MDYLFDPMLNDLVKEKYAMAKYGKIDNEKYFEAFCEQIEDFWYEQMKEYKQHNDGTIDVDMSLPTYTLVTMDANAICKKIKLKPTPRTHALIADLFNAENVLIYFKILHCNVNIYLTENRLSW